MSQITMRLLVGSLALVGSAYAGLPQNFLAEPVAGGWDQPVGLAFASDGRMFVWEKAGRVWLVENGVKSATPLIDIAEEVGNWRDYGLLGFAIDPDFYTNGYIYLLYVVDYHHLINFGTPQYDPFADQYFYDTIGRLTRYTCNAADGFRSVDPSSRTILIGESISTGFPIAHQSHGIGTVAFGHDGSLLVGCGDAASYEVVDFGGPINGSSNTAVADGILQPKEDIGAFRAQLVDSLNGKILRIDPVSGDGLADNPFYDVAAPRAARSRVWAMGLRNPFRFTVRPDELPIRHEAPGSIYIGDVGWYLWEDLNVCTAAGQNFGWPIFEGLQQSFAGYFETRVANQDAPNPLFGVGGCTQQYFDFQDLIRQATLEPNPNFPNPCDPGQNVPAGIQTFLHARPAIDWFHSEAGPARTGTFSGDDATEIELGALGSPVAGPQFGGFSSTGGAWYSGAHYPPEFQDVYFHADFAAGWIRAFVFDANDAPVEVRDFGSQLGGIVALAVNPVDETLYYINYDEFGGATVARASYYPDNLPPTAIASVDQQFGAAPLTVQFDASASSDPEGSQLTYLWDFGDGVTSNLPNPLHTYPAPFDVTSDGVFTARVFQLDPPTPQGGGNWDPEVMRDGDYPPIGNGESYRQYDTFHFGDQGNREFVGYEYFDTREFTRIVFQEGIHFGDGGWFDELRVQARIDDRWLDIPGWTIDPPYLGNNGVNYETFVIDFPPTLASGVRLFGQPGGFNDFISIGELRVFTTAPPLTEPTRFDVTLTVTDELGVPNSTTLFVTANNTPPDVQITSPADGSTYSTSENTTVDLLATRSDAEHSESELTCEWLTILHHNDHTHVEPADPACSSSSLLSPVGCEPNETYFYELRLTVTDPLGLATTASSFVYPDCGEPCPQPGCDGIDVAEPRDCRVDLSDLGVLLANWGVSPSGHALPGDSLPPFGEIDLSDLGAMLAGYGLDCN